MEKSSSISKKRKKYLDHDCCSDVNESVDNHDECSNAGILNQNISDLDAASSTCVNDDCFLDLPLDVWTNHDKIKRRKVSLSPKKAKLFADTSSDQNAYHIVEHAANPDVIDLTIDSPTRTTAQNKQASPSASCKVISRSAFESEGRLEKIAPKTSQQSTIRLYEIFQKSESTVSAGDSTYSECFHSTELERPEKELFRHSLLSSAYVQNLAEICHTFQNDVRWTIRNRKSGNNHEQLFSWSNGDDVCILHAFANLYRPPLDEVGTEKYNCSCLLCRNNIKNHASKALEVSIISKTIDTTKIGVDHDSKVLEVSIDTETIDTTKIGVDHDSKALEVSMNSKTIETTKTCVDENGIRVAYLYARLFYRKGPWFRLDDIYFKYYAPKKVPLHMKELVEDNEESKIIESTDIAFCDKENTVLEHIKCVSTLLEDLQILFSKGWIRTFNDEEECGKTVDDVLLRAKERKDVLAKLGYRGKEARLSLPNQQPVKNKIWKQMNGQRKLHFDKSEGNSFILPVRCHVDQIILDTFLEKIVQMCTKRDSRKVAMEDVQDMKLALHNTLKRMNIVNGIRFPLGAFRIREQPALTLQRCSRLYLCATVGPGDMRSDGLNAWRSLLNVDVSHKLDVSSVVTHPSLCSWYQVQYPGLLHRFGMRSYCYMDSYRIILPNETIAKSSHSDRRCQVFRNRAAFIAWELCVDLRANVDYLIQLIEMMRYNQRRNDKGKDVNPKQMVIENVYRDDTFGLLKVAGRLQTAERLLFGVPDASISNVITSIECHLQNYLLCFECETEKVVAIVGVIIFFVLIECNKHVDDEEVEMISSRPWMRHLLWQGCLSYILWDIIPMYERYGLHKFAVESLELLLFGTVKSDSTRESIVPIDDSATRLATALLSRRTRGKALERLFVDLTHWHRRNLACLEDKFLKRRASEKFQCELVKFCEIILDTALQTSRVPFSSLRKIAMRLKRPLAKTVGTKFCPEAFELGLRLGSDQSSDGEKKYRDWIPETDRAIANSLSNGESGTRCSFVGFEDDKEIVGSSLNVEQLAMEFYRTGRLPVDNDSLKSGGWIGFHDEGGHLRALFRILCSAPVLGMDWGCGVASSPLDLAMISTIHLTPYQDAPFDLHVGMELLGCSMSTNDITIAKTRGIYHRHQNRIVDFFRKLRDLSQQELCDLVHESISNRCRFMIVHKRKDPFMERDIVKSRILSLIAAGCGGPLLVAIFRCFLFDYRHYSGGLPDLLLIRARYSEEEQGVGSAPYLEEWVSQIAMSGVENQSNILYDKDDEFLGCKKVGDSGGRQLAAGGRKANPTSSPLKQETNDLSSASILEKTLLEVSGRKVFVECMMVEVKSSNDRLDPRQEDWLNVLDQFGNARVCKFERTKEIPEVIAKK